MTFTNYRCKHCAQTRAIDTSRVVKATFLRCDACFAISSLSLGDRLAMINAASPAHGYARAAARPQRAVSA